ncbi:MAG: hypothetical protein H0T75_06145, partial [Rhizobiales bacterium]|nr:hypothetical protein [Hyphomicrobiales bacterium]
MTMEKPDLNGALAPAEPFPLTEREGVWPRSRSSRLIKPVVLQPLTPGEQVLHRRDVPPRTSGGAEAMPMAIVAAAVTEAIRLGAIG